MGQGTFLIQTQICTTSVDGNPVLSWSLSANAATGQAVIGGFPNCSTGSDLTKFFTLTAEGGTIDNVGDTMSFNKAQGAAVSEVFTLPSGNTVSFSGTAESFTITTSASVLTISLALYLVNECGNLSLPQTQTITLQAPGPQASFSYISPSTGNYNFTDSSSASGCSGGITDYLWELPGKTPGVDFNFINSTTDTSPNPEIEFLQYGTYTVRLTVTTACGSHSTQQVITYFNYAPQAQNLSISGIYASGETLTASYTYFDQDGDAEGASTQIWYQSDDANGLVNKTQIGTGLSYPLTSLEVGKYVFIEIVPHAATGTSPGGTNSSTPGLIADTAEGIHDTYHDNYHS